MITQLKLESTEIKTLLRNKVTLEISQDYEDHESPRDFDCNLGVMITQHRRYNLGDFESIKEYFKEHEYITPETLKKSYGAVIILPIYLYDHSGITISTSPFSCHFDSGLIGYIYTTRKTILDNFIGYKRLSKKLLNKVTEQLISEIQTYDDYLTGNIYSYSLIDNITGEDLDSCCGFYGRDINENGIMSDIDTSKYEITETKYV